MKKSEIKNFDITCDTTYLYRRWIACYMLCDYNFIHAENSFISNQSKMFEDAYVLAKKQVTEETTKEDAQKILNDCYCEVLANDIETWILADMNTFKESRACIETEIAKIAYDLEKDAIKNYEQNTDYER